MARIRTIKPEFFRHEALFEAEAATKLPLRLAYAGLWTIADRDGRFRWQPRILKLDALPFDDCNFAAVLDALAEHGFIGKYEVAGEFYGFIPSWEKHQHVNAREAESKFPAPSHPDARMCTHVHARGEKERELEKEGEDRATPETRARDLDPFDAFWEAYPNKVGKRRSEAAYRSALKRAPAEVILEGLHRYVASKPPDRHWMNPTTYLNGDHWGDEPAVVARPATGPPRSRGYDGVIERAEAFLRSQEQPPDEPSHDLDLAANWH